MDDERRDDDEKRLQALFDDTASPPSPEALQRMARRAAEVPARRPQRWYRAPWVAGVALAAAAAGALYIGTRPDDPITSGTGPNDDPDEAEIAQLLDFGLADDGADTLDPGPLGGYLDDQPTIGGDHPVAALEVLFDDGDTDVATLEAVIEQVLGDGG